MEDKESEILIVCKHWIKGKCILGKNCKYLHPDVPILPSNPKKYNQNKFRCGAFRIWLLQHFGREKMKGGSGILDIAGGSSELSFQFLNLNGIQSTVIDPRNIKTTSFHRRLKFGFYHRNPFFSQFNDLELEPKDPPHIPLFFESELWMESKRRQSLDEYWEGSLEEWDQKYFQKAKERAKKASRNEYLEDMEWKTVQELLFNCSMVIGMHPDQATEAIVDFALYRRIPFAVVPCCTFANQFPKRKFPDGRVVKSYEDLIEYLISKDDCIGMDVLDFEGRNRLLYFPKD